MELITTNDKNSFDPTPKLKSSLTPILFISFNPKGFTCNYCGNNYSTTVFFYQKYCKNCLSKYISQITDYNTYLDVHVVTNNIQCNKHVVARNTDFCTRNIQEWCESCSEISYFRQIYNGNHYLNNDFKNEMDCKLCGKLIYRKI